MKVHSFCGHLHRKKAGSGWLWPSPKPWTSCDLRQHFARPDKVLPQGQTNQPLQLQSRVYGGEKKEKKQNRRETAQRIKGRRGSSLREGPTKVQFQVRPESVATVRDSEREGWEPQNPAKYPRLQSPTWYGSSCSLELRNQFIGSQPSSAQNQIGRKHQISEKASIRRESMQYQPVLKPRQSCYNKAKRICK